MIYTTYFANLKNLPENIIPVSICGKAPNGYRGLQYKKLAPKYSFFSKWKETGDNDYYVRCYRDEILNTLDPCNVVTELYKLVYGGRTLTEEDLDLSIVLVCYETPEKFCHRHLVSRWLKQNGIPCYEWRKDNNYEGL